MIVFNLEQIKTIYEDAANKYPNEGCGILLGERDRRKRRIVREVYITNNAAEEKLQKKQYKIPTDAVLYAELLAAQNNYEIIGFYHSHTDCPAEASKEDGSFAIPGMSYPIMSIEGGRIKELLSWEKVWIKGQEAFVKELIGVTD